MKKLYTIGIGLLLACAHANAQVITTFAGEAHTGSVAFGGDGGAATAALLNRPTQIALDTLGNVYFADMDNHRVRKVMTNGTIMTIAGNGNPIFAGDGGPADSASLMFPSGVAVDKKGNVFIADLGNHRIRKVSNIGVITTYAGCDSCYIGDGRTATATQLDRPDALAIDAIGNLYFAEQIEDVVRRIDTNGIVTTIAGTNTSGYTGDGGPAIAAKLNQPQGLALDAAGNLYIADYINNAVRKINTAGIITTVAGGVAGGYSGDGGPATAAGLGFPTGVSADAYGNLFIADGNNNRVRKMNGAGIISTVAGTGIANYNGDGGMATDAALNQPFDVVVDATGNLYIADAGNSVIRFVAKEQTGVPQVKAGQSFAMYPNPGDGNFMIRMAACAQPSHLIVTDLTGRSVTTQVIAPNTTSLPIQMELPTGTYIIKLQNADRTEVQPLTVSK